MNRIDNLLKDNKLSITAGRQQILELFFSAGGALSHADIEKNTDGNFDRVTIYRTLNAFVNKGIIHVIPSADNNIKYALCKDDCEEGHHHDHHIHFECTACHSTLCLDEVLTPDIKLPAGYKPHMVEVMVTGICKKCNSR